MKTTKHHRSPLSFAAAIMAGCASLHAAPVIYEPFAQAATTNLNGVTASATGLSPSTWATAANAWRITDDSLTKRRWNP